MTGLTHHLYVWLLIVLLSMEDKWTETLLDPESRPIDITNVKYYEAQGASRRVPSLGLAVCMGHKGAI